MSLLGIIQETLSLLGSDFTYLVRFMILLALGVGFSPMGIGVMWYEILFV